MSPRQEAKFVTLLFCMLGLQNHGDTIGSLICFSAIALNGLVWLHECIEERREKAKSA